MRFFEDIEIGQRRELGSFTFTAELIKKFARAIRSAALSSRRRGRPQIAVRRAGGIGLACRIGLHEAAGGRRPAPGRGRPPRAARRSRSGDRRRVFANCAGSSRCWRATPSVLPARSKRCGRRRSVPNGASLQARNTGTNQRGEMVFSLLATAFVPRTEAPATPEAHVTGAWNNFLITHFEPCARQMEQRDIWQGTTMVDRGGLKLVGFIFATVTLAVMLATGMVVKGYADGAYSLEAATADRSHQPLTITAESRAKGAGDFSGSRPAPAPPLPATTVRQTGA